MRLTFVKVVYYLPVSCSFEEGGNCYWRAPNLARNVGQLHLDLASPVFSEKGWSALGLIFSIFGEIPFTSKYVSESRT